jgi:hypothetical protein
MQKTECDIKTLLHIPKTFLNLPFTWGKMKERVNLRIYVCNKAVSVNTTVWKISTTVLPNKLYNITLDTWPPFTSLSGVVSKYDRFSADTFLLRSSHHSRVLSVHLTKLNKYVRYPLGEFGKLSGDWVAHQQRKAVYISVDVTGLHGQPYYPSREPWEW